SSKETRAELANMLTDVQATLTFYQGWMELDSPTVGTAYNSLINKIRERNREYRREALSSPPAREDKDIEITPYDFNHEVEQDHCITVMRKELKLFKWPSRYRLTLKRHGKPLPGSPKRQQPHRPHMPEIAQHPPPTGPDDSC